MCDLHEGALAADYILKAAFGIEVSKALNPLDDTDFLVISARLSAALQKAAKGEEGRALTAAMNALDVDWASLSAAARNRVIVTTRNLAQGITDGLLPKIDKQLASTGKQVATDTRSFASRAFNLQIGQSLNSADKASIDFLRTSQRLFVTDAYGNKIASASVKAADIVARGLEAGMGSSDITERLQESLGRYVERPSSYWDVVSMAYVNDARSSTQLNAFSEAGIEAYMFIAVNDEHTTETCFLAGTQVHTPSGLRSIETLLPGDLVITGKGILCPIEATSKRLVSDWAIITMEDDETITATPDHPFLTDKGWTGASSIESDTCLRLSPLRQRNTRSQQGPQILRNEVQRCTQERDLLLRGMHEDCHSSEVPTGQGRDAVLLDGLQTQRSTAGGNRRGPPESVYPLHQALQDISHGGSVAKAPDALLKEVQPQTHGQELPSVRKAVHVQNARGQDVLRTAVLSAISRPDASGASGTSSANEGRAGVLNRIQGREMVGGRSDSEIADRYRGGRDLLALGTSRQGSPSQGKGDQEQGLDVGKVLGGGTEGQRGSVDNDIRDYLEKNREVKKVKNVESVQIQAYCYNIQVGGDPTYLVGSGIVVHNCKFLDGKTFSMSSAQDTMSKLSKLEDPSEIKDAKPWIKNGVTEDGTRILFIDKGGKRELVAEVVRSGVGTKDAKSEYRMAMSDKKLEDSGIPIPPLHGRCRSTIIPV